MDDKKVNVRVEYELTPVRHLAIQCPECQSWFEQDDIVCYHISYSYEMSSNFCNCPKCETYFKLRNVNIEECNSSKEVYKDILSKKVIWE